MRFLRLEKRGERHAAKERQAADAHRLAARQAVARSGSVSQNSQHRMFASNEYCSARVFISISNQWTLMQVGFFWTKSRNRKCAASGFGTEKSRERMPSGDDWGISLKFELVPQ